MSLLTDDEIMNLYDWDFWNKIQSEGIGKALKAQDTKSRRELVAWLEAPCEEHPLTEGTPIRPRYYCEDCHLALHRGVAE